MNIRFLKDWRDARRGSVRDIAETTAFILIGNGVAEAVEVKQTKPLKSAKVETKGTGNGAS